MLRSAAHETYHFVENYSAKDAADLRDYVVDALKGKGVDIDEALEKYAKQGYATRDEQISELVADSMFDVFSNEDFIKDLTAKNQTLAKRLANHIGELVNKIRDAVKMLSVRYSNPEIKALMDDAEKLDTIRNMLLEGYKRAGENFKAEQAKGQKNNAVKMTTDKSSGIKFSKKESYDSSMQNTIDGYLEAVDEGLLSFVQKYYNNPNEEFDRFSLSKVSPKQAKDLNELLDVDFSGYSNAINKSAVNHINKRHGKNGEQDNSMSNINDFARLNFIIDNYDDIEIITFEDGDFDLSKEFRNSDNTPAKLIRMKKKVNGTFYVVEAVPENKYKKIWVASAYIQKNGAVTQVPTTKSSGSFLVSPDSINSISKTIKSVKQNLSVSDTEYIDKLKSERSELAEEYREIRSQIDEMKSSAEYKAFDDEVRTIRKDGSRFGGFEAVKQVRQKQKEWAKSAGLSALEERFYNISEQLHDYDLEIYKLDKAQKERVTAELTDKVKKFSHNEVTDYVVRAAQKFGITNKFDNAGYMLTNGNLLDFSDGQGYRVLDHREIREVLDFLPDNGNRSDGLIQFMNMGNIRMQIGGIDISKAPNKQQIPVLREFFNKNNGEITVDFSKENGDNAGSIEYPIGTKSEKILNDIKAYFENGTLPQISSVAAFHSIYSRKQSDPIQAHYAEVMRENRNLKNIISALDDMQYSSARNNIHLDGRDIHNIAGRLLRNASSKYELKTFEDELTAVYDYMANRNKKGRFLTAQHLYDNITSK
ncbi:MAG: hypothetical protein IKV76_03500 [Clostridia bacterium]|nr:hypothetical protein [Clostridia bacterium]